MAKYCLLGKEFRFVDEPTHEKFGLGHIIGRMRPNMGNGLILFLGVIPSVEVDEFLPIPSDIISLTGSTKRIDINYEKPIILAIPKVPWAEGEQGVELYLHRIEFETNEEWLSSLPPTVQIIARSYPTGMYRIKEGAPYGITCPGSKVELISYNDNGEVSVLIKSKDLTTEGKAHLMALCIENKKDFYQAIRRDHKVRVDPRYLERISDSDGVPINISIA